LTIAELFATIGVDVNQAQFDKANAEVKKLEGSFKKSFTEINSALELGKKAFGAFQKVVESTVGAAAELVKSIALQADDVATLADTYGVTADELQRLSASADLGDASIEDLTKGMSVLAKTASAAAEGGAEAMESLAGVQYKDAQGNLLGMSDMMLNVSDKMSKMTNKTERLAYAQKVLGKSGKGLVPWLSQGRAEILASMDAYERSGARLTAGQIEAGSAFDFADKKLGYYVQGLKNAFVTQENITKLTGAYDAFMSLLEKPIIKKAIKELSDAFGKLVDWVTKTITEFDKWLDTGNNQVILWQRIKAALITATIAVAAFGVAMWGSGIAEVAVVALAAAAAITAIYLAVDDLLSYMSGGDSVIGKFMAWLNSPADEGGLMGTFHFLLIQVQDLIKWIAKLTLKDFTDALAWVSKWTGLDLMISGFKILVDSIKTAVNWWAKLLGIDMSKVDVVGAVARTVLGPIAAIPGVIQSSESSRRSIQLPSPNQSVSSYVAPLQSVVPSSYSNSTSNTSKTVAPTFNNTVHVNLSGSNLTEDQIAAAVQDGIKRSNDDAILECRGI